MNCLHIVSGDLWAGAEVSVFELASELARRAEHSVGAVVLNPGTLEAKLRGAGVRTWVVDERRTGMAAILARSKAAAAEFAPDVVHSHRYKEHLIGAVLSAATATPHVRTAYGLSPRFDWAGGAAGAGAMVDEAVADWTGSIWIVVSRDLARRMSGLRRTIHVVPNGIAPAPPAPDRSTLLAASGGPETPGPWLIGFAGRLEPVKRPDRFLRAIAALPERVGDRRVHGIVLGDGSQAARLRGLAMDLGLRGRVSFLGHCEGADALVAALDVLVISSDHEGLPMVLLEAMRSGVPVAATAVGGVLEALGASPWLVDPHDEAALPGAVMELLSDAPRRAEWSRLLVERFRNRFTIATVADRVLEVYEQAADRARTTAGRHARA